MNPALDIQPMRREDLDTALGWARDEGWNPGIEDAAAFHAADPTGFLMTWHDGQPIGCISVVKHGTSFAFLGLYIVRPEHRGKGYGKAIWDAGIASAADRTIGLDGVVAQQENYRKSGFVLAYKSARWGGPAKPRATPAGNVAAVTMAHMAAIMDYDRKHFPEDRRLFLARWLAHSDNRLSAVALNDGAVAGYGTIRRAQAGWKVGPLFAEDAATADRLLDGLIAESGAESISIDMPEPNAAATELARSRGLSPSFETARMYLGPAPDLPLREIFGITTLELG